MRSFHVPSLGGAMMMCVILVAAKTVTLPAGPATKTAYAPANGNMKLISTSRIRILSFEDPAVSRLQGYLE